MGMHGEDVNNNAVIINSVDKAMLTVNAARPHPGKGKAQGFRLADACIWVLGYIGKQQLNAVYHLHITALDKSIVMVNRSLGKDYSVHETRSSSWSIDSPSCWAVTRP